MLSQLVASTVTSSVLCGEAFYMGGGCEVVVCWCENKTIPPHP